LEERPNLYGAIQLILGADFTGIDTAGVADGLGSDGTAADGSGQTGANDAATQTAPKASTTPAPNFTAADTRCIH
jgi:hypothetical protein